jgi:hypothetical protein
MPGVSLEDAMDRVVGSVSSLGDSAAGLITILAASITATAYDLGGRNWLLVHSELWCNIVSQTWSRIALPLTTNCLVHAVVEMEKFFILGAGGVIAGVGAKLGMDFPAGMFMFVSADYADTNATNDLPGASF